MITDKNFVQLALSRHSVGARHQILPAPDVASLRLAVSTAMRAPNHEKKLPLRFVEIVSREKLADLFESTLPADAEESVRIKTREKGTKGPMCVALIQTDLHDDISPLFREERLITAGCALMNFLNALHAQGFVAKTVSPRPFTAPNGLYDPENERVIAFIIIGSPETSLTYEDIDQGHDEHLPLSQW